MTFDPRVTLALILALVLETAGSLVWIGGAAARLREVERAVVSAPQVSERLARVEGQLAEQQRTLARIEQRLDARDR